MAMRYHFGLGIGHTYSHEHMGSTTPLPHPSEGNMEDEGDDLCGPSDSLQSELNDSESDRSSADGSDSEPDEGSGKSDSESILGEYVDMDGWNDADMDTFDEYEF